MFNPDVLVVGGGIAGIQASLDIANGGYKVYLVERGPSVGGRMIELDRTFPTLESSGHILAPKITEVSQHPCIELLTCSEVEKVSGSAGNFAIGVRKKAINSGGTDGMSEFNVGSIVVATGYDQFDPRKMPEYGYGKYDNILTGLEFEKMTRVVGDTGGGVRLKDGREPESVAIVHCVGSRDENHHEYCSRVCCMYGLKYAHLLKELTDNRVEVYEMYIDMRCFGEGHEEFYRRVCEEGIIFIRGKAGDVIPDLESGKLIITCADTLLGKVLRIPVDMVILCCALEARSDADGVAKLFNLNRRDDGFFLEAHPKLAPVSTSNDGVFVAGCCVGPKDISDTVTQASAAAAKTLSLISKHRQR